MGGWVVRKMAPFFHGVREISINIFKTYRASIFLVSCFFPGFLLCCFCASKIKRTCSSVREYFRKNLPLHYECMAGGGAGFCQVIVTSPMELLKIKGQSKAQLNGPITAGHVTCASGASQMCAASQTTKPSLLREVSKAGGVFNK